jgi:methyltransferase (TIGR00027 family)
LRPGQESRTAVLTCMGRAAAEGPAFSDPTALALLPDDAREKVERFRSGTEPRSARERFGNLFIENLSKMMVPRTVAIDEAVRAAKNPQLAILGAGLDGRAWRMEELRDATVFEVDHPDSQARKKARAASLTLLARELRFVPIDFTRGELDSALAGAGHDAARPTTWIWEGVVMYLTIAQIEATLSVIAKRSAKGSALSICYRSPSLMATLTAAFTRFLGEPNRSAQTPEEMQALLARFGFLVEKDEDLSQIAARLRTSASRRGMLQLRVATASRRA